MILQLMLHFIELRITTHSERIAAWISDFFQSYEQTELFPQRSTFNIFIEEINSQFEQNLRSMPSSASPTRYFLFHGLCRYHQGVFYAESEGELRHRTVVDVREQSVYINVGGAFLDHCEYFIYHIMRELLRKVLFPLKGVVGIHSAIVVKGANTVCLTGAAGMGKSTLGLKLAESGFSIMSDDQPMVTLLNGQPVVLSSLDCLSLSADTLLLCPSVSDKITGYRRLASKSLVRLSDLPPTTVCLSPRSVTHFVDLRRDKEQQLQLYRTEKMHSVQEMIKSSLCLFSPLDSSPINFHAIDQNSFDTIVRLFDGAETLTLTYSDEHLCQLPELFNEMLAKEQLSPKQ